MPDDSDFNPHEITDWDKDMDANVAAKVERIRAEVNMIHRENRSRDKLMNTMALDIKLLLQIVNEGRGGLRVAHFLWAAAGSGITFGITKLFS